ncbi:MAG: hypothetical protein J6O62_02605 [Bacilli bacterium]|nr:hypothetical protein [Bacilli bacterium]MBO6195555.1 hypothetical protein [Bacilli bacterium]
MKDLINIQNKIYKYKNNYVIYDYDVEKIFNIPIRYILNTNKKFFLNYIYKINNNYILTEKALVTLSLLLGPNYDDKCIKVLKVFEYIKKNS